jgi:hypothetical protein
VRPRAFLVAAIATAILTADAAAYRPIGPRWDDRVVTYHLASPEHRWSLERAVQAWNASGARIKFAPAPPARARVRIVERPSDALGRAAFSSARGRIRSAVVELSPGLDRFVSALVLTHELGHALGLAHDDRGCATMNSFLRQTGLPAKCFAEVAAGKWFCRLLQPDDVRGVVAIYGGRPRLPRGTPTCFKWQVPGPVEALTAALISPSAAAVSWVPPLGEGLAHLELRRGLESCPGPGEGEWIATSEPDSTSVEDVLEGQPAGRYCYSVVAVEEAGRAGPAATVWLDFPGAPPTP